MARSTQTIFNTLLDEKKQIPALDGLSSSSSTAIWRLLLYVVAFCTNVLERLWDLYRNEVNAEIDAMIPHRPKWYRDKVLAFMADTSLPEDRDTYDTEGMDDDQIAAARVVKHAVASENSDSSLLTIKVAGEDVTTGERKPLSQEHATQLTAYIQEIKDAGVRFLVVNQSPDLFNCEVDIYYNPMKDPTTVQYDCEKAIKDYIENLPFNGAYSNMALIDALQEVDGVRVAELKSSTSAPYGTTTDATIDAIVVPDAGYFKANRIVLNLKANKI